MIASDVFYIYSSKVCRPPIVGPYIARSQLSDQYLRLEELGTGSYKDDVHSRGLISKIHINRYSLSHRHGGLLANKSTIRAKDAYRTREFRTFMEKDGAEPIRRVR